MIRLILAVILLFVVVAGSALLVGDKGYLLIAMGDITIESTVVTALIMLAFVFVVSFITIKLIRGGYKVGARGWHKVIFANRNKARRLFKQGITHYLLEDYAQAEQTLVKSAQASGNQALALLVAAVAADKQGIKGNSQHYLQQLEQIEQANNETISLESVLIKLQLMITHKEFESARQLLDQHHKLIGHDLRLLAQEIELCLIEKRYQVAIERLVLARKQKQCNAEKLANWEYKAFYGEFTRLIKVKNLSVMQEFWQQLSRKLKQRETILLAYCQVLAEQKLTEPLNELLIPAIKKDASERFLHQIILLPISNPEALVEVVQKQLHKNKSSIKWLRVLAHLACHAKQWQMAEKAFSALHVELQQQQLTPSAIEKKLDAKKYALALNQQGKYQQANELLSALL
jgi:HemY protein